MFLMFAMTSDAVGSVIPRIIEEFRLNLTAAGAFHYVPMAAIALGAILLGFLADRLGRKPTIIIGLALYGLGSLLFAVGNSFGFFVLLLGISGLGISVFKIGALALIGDISTSTREHTSLMNTVEGFFGVGSIIGPAIVAALLGAGMSWKWLYVVAAAICALLLLVAVSVRYPQTRHSDEAPISLAGTFRMMGNPYAAGFSLLIALYVAAEVAIYVWMPTYLKSYEAQAPLLTAYALTAFFVLRAAGRFLGAWLLNHYSWSLVLACFGIAIFACFAGSLIGGAAAGVYLLPLSGLFMSMLYPTLNSKCISCFEKSHHGAVAGVTLFFTAAAAAACPLVMAAVSDAFGSVSYGFVFATVLTLLLAIGLIYNWLRNPAAARLSLRDRSEYG
jgi:MFS transporter, DHA1 family, quinolone resistance protein